MNIDAQSIYWELVNKVHLGEAFARDVPLYDGWKQFYVSLFTPLIDKEIKRQMVKK